MSDFSFSRSLYYLFSTSLFLYFIGAPPELVRFIMGGGGGFSFFTQLRCPLISYLPSAGWQQPSMKPPPQSSSAVFLHLIRDGFEAGQVGPNRFGMSNR